MGFRIRRICTTDGNVIRASHRTMSNGHRAFAQCIGIQTDSRTVFVISTGSAADRYSSVSFRMGIGADSDAANPAASNRASAIQIHRRSMDISIHLFHCHLRPGRGIMTDSHGAFAHCIGVQTYRRSILVIGAGHKTQCQGTVSFRMGIGTHSYAAFRQ